MLADRPVDRPASVAESAGLAEVAARLWRRTHDPADRDRAVAQFRTLMADRRFSLDDFHVLQGFGRLVLLLQEDRAITPEQDRAIRALAGNLLDQFVKSNDNQDNNIRLAQVLGCACLLTYLERAGGAVPAGARERLDAYWKQIVATGDLDEDASNYDSLGAAFLADLAVVLSREDDLRRSPGFRRMFARFREMVSPSGLIPEYGDAYFSYNSWPLDRVFLLEYAAALYDDPTFLDAARRLTARPNPSVPAFDAWYRAIPLIALPLSDAAPRAPRGSPSVVTERSRRGAPAPLIDKLILRTGREPGAAMVMLDLYARGSHAHTEKGPSIAYFEAGEVPLFHNLGRHATRSAICGNLPWALPDSRRFPGCWNRPGEWFTMTIPTEYLTHEGGLPVVARSMQLRNFREHNRACRAVWFDDLRLEGQGGSRLIDDFEDPTRWPASFRKVAGVALSDDHTQGRASEEAATWAPVPSGHITRTFGTPMTERFTSAEFPYLRLDLKYEGARPYAHIRGLGRQLDLGDQSLPAEVKAATVEQRGGDAYGRVEYRAYLTPDSTLVRHLVLTAEGLLVVRDMLTPGPSMAGWQGGQLWQLYALKARGDGWFCSDDDGAYPAVGGGTKSARLLVRFAGGETGVEGIRQAYHDPNPRRRKPERFFTTFSRRPIVPGRAEAFAMVAYPHPPGDDPVDVAARVRVQDEARGTVATLAGGRVSVRIADAAWAVERSR